MTGHGAAWIGVGGAVAAALIGAAAIVYSQKSDTNDGDDVDAAKPTIAAQENNAAPGTSTSLHGTYPQPAAKRTLGSERTEGSAPSDQPPTFPTIEASTSPAARSRPTPRPKAGNTATFPAVVSSPQDRGEEGVWDASATARLKAELKQISAAIQWDPGDLDATEKFLSTMPHIIKSGDPSLACFAATAWRRYSDADCQFVDGSVARRASHFIDELNRQCGSVVVSKQAILRCFE
jgi:hypothetical protein